MPSLIDEHTQFVDSSGAPIVNGKIYIGTRNLNPVSNPITIYSDRGLSTSLSQPQRTDSNGRAVNKIWVPGRYSIRVDTSADVQQYQELDAGEEEQTGITSLTNVQGTNTITAEGTPTAVTSLVNRQVYVFTAANTITGAATLQIDLAAAKSIKQGFDQDLAAGVIEQDQTVAVAYNAADDVFELVSHPSGFSHITGTWTPTLRDLTNSDAEGQVYNTQNGKYFKVGNSVYIEGRLEMTSLGTLTAAEGAKIGGLPFTTTNDDLRGVISFGFTTGMSVTAGNVPMGMIDANTDAFSVYLWDSAGGVSSCTITELGGAGINIYFSGWYTAV